MKFKAVNLGSKVNESEWSFLFWSLDFFPKAGTIGHSFISSCLYTSLFLYLTVSSLKLLLQACLSLCDPIDGSPPGSPVPGILQARTLEWVAISFSTAWKWKVKVKLLSRVWLLVTPWTAAHQAPLSLGFSRQEYWSRVPFLAVRDVLNKCFKNKVETQSLRAYFMLSLIP